MNAPLGLRLLPLKSVLSACLVLQTFCAHAQARAPVAHKGATAIKENARFTVLTPRVIRMEWSEDGIFEDRASLTFVIRDLPVPSFFVEGSMKTLPGEAQSSGYLS